ncbi:unnamed protein product [Heligmosomoides polygyrus]|uniref:Myb_DNA-bind_5 domain-containing protein n=1 Tax=Heligmosomoides polygyrus TaxID=6339 RepID=A0A183G9L7_HELPZ|nr:unnamed protein product [Heligmosomoides polygyrus]
MSQKRESTSSDHECGSDTKRAKCDAAEPAALDSNTMTEDTSPEVEPRQPPEEVTDSSVMDIPEHVKDTLRTHAITPGEKELRRERGEMLVKLFREHPSLAGSATARKAEKNLERAQMWEQIAQQVNEEFGSRLEVLTVEKVKKLLTYYKKKDDGNFDHIKAPSQVVVNETPPDREEGCSSPPSRCESVISEHGGFENDSPTAVAVVNTTEVDQQLQNFIASLCTSPYDLSSTARSDEIDSSSSPAPCDTAYQLKKERHDFVVSLAEHYMERMCFDSSSRSAQVNAERHNMWVKIAHLTNEKYVGLLTPLGVEQTKKLFSNCKRRRRLRMERNGSDSPFVPLPAVSVSVSPNGSSGDANSSNDTMPALDIYLNSNVRDLDVNIEIKELRRQLADRDAEVARLQRKIVEQANDYKARISSIAEILKTATDRKVSEDIRVYISAT